MLCLTQDFMSRKGGIFAGTLIKKRRYWPTLFLGDAMDLYFKNKQVGECDAISGVLDKEQYFILGVKEPDNVMKFMVSGGTLILDNNCKKVTRKCTERNGTARQEKFTYMKPYDWHFCYCHIVDDHNNLCHASLALQEILITKHWNLRVFTFLLAITKVNLYLVSCLEVLYEN